MLDKVTESPWSGYGKVDMDWPVSVSQQINVLDELTHLLTSLGNFLSFQTPLSKTPPSIGKSDLSTPSSVQAVPGCRDSLNT